MIDLEQARLVVERREQERIDALVQEEAANEEHRRAMIATAQIMAASQARIKAQKIDAHNAAVLVARAALDSLKILTAERERCESKLGFSRGDLAEAQKRRDRCTRPLANSFPLPSEIDAWVQRRGYLDDGCFEISARIAVETAELDRAKIAEWEGEDKFKEAARVEWERRSGL